VYVLFCLSFWLSLFSGHLGPTIEPLLVVGAVQQLLVMPLLVWTLARAINGVAPARVAAAR
jgi:hypothetical protein